jgi:hypothetical protein
LEARYYGFGFAAACMRQLVLLSGSPLCVPIYALSLDRSEFQCSRSLLLSLLLSMWSLSLLLNQHRPESWSKWQQPGYVEHLTALCITSFSHIASPSARFMWQGT